MREAAEALMLLKGDSDQIYWLGAAPLPDSVKSYIRLPAGHHEDFFEALANLHCTMERTIRRARGEKVPPPYDHPGLREGLAGMKFVRAAVASSKARCAWTRV